MRIRTAMLLLMTMVWLGNACDENTPFDASKIPLGTPQSGTITDGTPSVGTPTGPGGGGGAPPPPPTPPPPPPPPEKDDDQDGIPDATDNCPQHANANQLNIAGHPTLGDRCNPAIVWVSTTGKDDNAGTYESPVVTVEKGIDLIIPPAKSGHIFLLEGTYPGAVDIGEGVTVVGGFAEENGQIIHDPKIHVTTLTHDQSLPVIGLTATGNPNPHPSTIRDVHIQHSNLIQATGIFIKGVPVTIQNVHILVESPISAVGIMSPAAQQVNQLVHLESNTIQINPNSPAPTSAFAMGAWLMNVGTEKSYLIKFTDNTITVGQSALAAGVAVIEDSANSEIWIQHNTVHIDSSGTAIGLALGWEKTMSSKMPVDALTGAFVALYQNQVSVAAKTRAIGLLLRGTHDLKIANNAVKAEALVDTTKTIGLVASAIADDAMFFANTIRVYGGDTATALHLNGIAGKTALINNLLDLQKGIENRTAVQTDNLVSIELMTRNMVVAKGSITYFAQSEPGAPLTVATPEALAQSVATGKATIKTFVAADNLVVANAKFLNTSEPVVASDSPTHDAGFDLTQPPVGADPKAAGFQELAVDVFGTTRPQGKGWDIGAFEQ